MDDERTLVDYGSQVQYGCMFRQWMQMVTGRGYPNLGQGSE